MKSLLCFVVLFGSIQLALAADVIPIHFDGAANPKLQVIMHEFNGNTYSFKIHHAIMQSCEYLRSSAQEENWEQVDMVEIPFPCSLEVFKIMLKFMHCRTFAEDVYGKIAPLLELNNFMGVDGLAQAIDKLFTQDSLRLLSSAQLVSIINTLSRNHDSVYLPMVWGYVAIYQKECLNCKRKTLRKLLATQPKVLTQYDQALKHYQAEFEQYEKDKQYVATVQKQTAKVKKQVSSRLSFSSSSMR